MLRSPSLRLEAQAAVGIARPQVVEADARLGCLRLAAVHRLHLQQREVALPLLRRADLARHRVTRAQVESLDLRRRDVDVVGAVEVVPVLAAQESVSLGQDLEHAFADERLRSVEQLLLDPEDEILAPERVVRRDVELIRHVVQLRHRPSLELSDVHEANERGRIGRTAAGGRCPRRAREGRAPGPLARATQERDRRSASRLA